MPIELRTPEAKASKAFIIPRRGGVLTSLTLTAGQRSADVLWMPDQINENESGWPGGGMPLMFPFAGRVFYNGQPFQYELGGKLYNMPLHGFSYALVWQVKEQTPSAVTLSVSASARTEPLFPYDFALETTYELHGDHLRVLVSAENRGLMPDAAQTGAPAAMPVAMGLHPYFRMPLTGGAKADTRLVTSAQEKIAVTNAGGAGKASEFPGDGENDLPLTAPLLGNLILGKHAKPSARLLDKTAELAIEVSWDRPDLVQYAVLWTREGEAFHCLEPWMGLPDAVSTGAGVCWLPRGEKLDLGFTIKLVDAR